MSRQALAGPVVALGLGVALAFLITQPDRRFSLIALGLLLAATLPFTPIVALLILIPLSMGGSLQEIAEFPIDLTQLVSLLLAAAIVLHAGVGKLRLRRSMLDGPLLLLGFAAIISLRSVSADATLLINLLSFFTLFGAYFLGFQVLDSRSRLLLALSVFVGAVTVLALTHSVLLFTGRENISLLGHQLTVVAGWGGTTRLGGPFEQPNTFAQLLILGAPVAMAAALSPGMPRRSLWAAAAAVLMLALLLSQSRSAIIGVFVSSVVLLFLLRRHAVIRGLIGAAAIVALVLWLVQSSPAGPSLQGRFDPAYQQTLLHAEGSGLAQASTIPAALKLFVQHPFGVGFRQASLAVGQELGVSERATHNMLLTWALDFGVLGLAAGLWLIVRQVRLIWSRAQALQDIRDRAILSGLLGGLIATWIHNMAHSTVMWGPVWLFFALASAAYLLFGSSPQPESGAEAPDVRERS